MKSSLGSADGNSFGENDFWGVFLFMKFGEI